MKQWYALYVFLYSHDNIAGLVSSDIPQVQINYAL